MVLGKEGIKRAAVLLFGGIGSERRVSELGAANLIKKAKSAGAELLTVGIAPTGEWYICPADDEKIAVGEWLSDPSKLVPTFVCRFGGVGGLVTDKGVIPVEKVIPLLHGDGGEDGSIQGALDTAGIKYFGCDASASAIAYDKAYTKILAESLGIPTVPWILYINAPSRAKYECGRIAYTEEGAAELASTFLGERLFVKPSRSGSSVGASVAENRRELISAIRRALQYSDRVIIEKLIASKTELECAYFGCGKEIITPPAAIDVGGGFYDYGTKYGSKSIRTQTVFSAYDIGERVRSYTGALAGLLSVRDISRFDYFLTDRGEIYFNEVNTFPGFTERSMYLDMLAAAGIGICDFLEAALGQRSV